MKDNKFMERVKPIIDKKCERCGMLTLGECGGFTYCYSSAGCDWSDNPNIEEVKKAIKEKQCFGGEWVND